MSKNDTSTEQQQTAIRELDAVIAKFRKEKGSDIILPGNRVPLANHIPTGSFILDFALLGGFPEGYLSMVYGPPSCGKTTLLKKLVGNFQRKHPDKAACWVDTEGMFDAEWATKLGCDTDALMLVRPETGQAAVDVSIGLMGAQEVGLLVLDSVPNCVPQKMLENSAEDQTMTELARLMGLFCSKISMSYARERKRGHYVTVILVNQFRTAVGVMFGDTRMLPGGKQINHAPTTKLSLRNKEVMGKDRFSNEVVEHNQHGFTIEKAKHGSSIRSGEFRMAINPDNVAGFGVGDFMDCDTLAVYGKRMGLITGGGSSWRIDGVEDKFQRLSDMELHLKNNPDAKLALSQALIGMQRQSKGLPTLPPDGYLLDWCELVTA